MIFPQILIQWINLPPSTKTITLIQKSEDIEAKTATIETTKTDTGITKNSKMMLNLVIKTDTVDTTNSKMISNLLRSMLHNVTQLLANLPPKILPKHAHSQLSRCLQTIKNHQNLFLLIQI